jgi:hypothetical protein
LLPLNFRRNNFFFSFFFFLLLCAVGDQLRDVVKQSCTAASHPFKDDPKTWGVTFQKDARLTAYQFGEYKSKMRLEAEEKLRTYMREPSEPRAPELNDFAIAVTVAAPGTGKTRLIDDAMRMPLGARDGEVDHFDSVLRLAVTFNSNYSGAYVFPLTARMLLLFFCGAVKVDAAIVLGRIDAALIQLYPSTPIKEVALRVLDALEALYFKERGGKLGRTVLLIDEISKVDMMNVTSEASKQHVYNTVVGWLNGGVMAGTDKSRRGAVFTGLSAIAPWSKQTRQSGRSIVWLPLGTFDLFDENVRAVVVKEAEKIKGWSAGAVISERVWHLLAATGGRPRDVSSMLVRLSPLLRLVQPFSVDLLRTLFAKEPAASFRQYLLPSMLNISFFAMMGEEMSITQFGRDAASVALLNADQVATRASRAVVPSVSLGHASVVGDEHLPLFDEINVLILSTTFCKLDGSGKDFERVWVLLVHTVLRLQHIVRCTDKDFWPRLLGDSVNLGGLARPTRKALNVFATTVTDKARARALFGFPIGKRVWQARDSSINRRLPLTCEPTLAWWNSVWTPKVEPGAHDDIPEGWQVALDVAWRPWTVVCFADREHEAVDFALMVGDASGTKAKLPHIYLFQCRALTTKNVAQKNAMEIVAKLKARLDVLFSADFAATHVWRLAGINSVKQVTLCVAAINVSDGIKLEKLNAPFNIVLFDSDDFRALGGAAFRDTYFFRHLEQMNV